MYLRNKNQAKLVPQVTIYFNIVLSDYLNEAKYQLELYYL